MQIKSTYDPTTGELLSDSFESQTVKKFEAQRSMHSGETRPDYLNSGDFWIKTKNGVAVGIYQWFESNGTTDGTLITQTPESIEEMLGSTEEAFQSELNGKYDKTGGSITGNIVLDGIGANIDTVQDTLSITLSADEVSGGLSFRRNKTSNQAYALLRGYNLVDTSDQGVISIYLSDGSFSHNTRYGRRVPAPEPVSASTVTVGSWGRISASGNTYTFPSGGTYVYYLGGYKNTGELLETAAGIVAGGYKHTQSLAYFIRGFYWRVS